MFSRILNAQRMTELRHFGLRFVTPTNEACQLMNYELNLARRCEKTSNTYWIQQAPQKDNGEPFLSAGTFGGCKLCRFNTFKSLDVTESIQQVLILAGSRPLVSIVASHCQSILENHDDPPCTCARVSVVSIVFTLTFPSGDCPSVILPISLHFFT